MRLGFLPYTAILVLLLTTSAVGCLAFFGPYTGDSGRYLRLAANLADGNGLSAATQPPYDPEVFRPPMYPLFLAGLKGLGLDVYGIILVQVILYLVAINFAMRTTVAVTGNQLAAGLLGFLMAAHPALMRWTVSITTEVLCTTLFCLVAWCVAKDLRQPTWSNTIVLGICIVTLFLTR